MLSVIRLTFWVSSLCILIANFCTIFNFLFVNLVRPILSFHKCNSFISFVLSVTRAIFYFFLPLYFYRNKSHWWGLQSESKRLRKKWNPEFTLFLDLKGKLKNHLSINIIEGRYKPVIYNNIKNLGKIEVQW